MAILGENNRTKNQLYLRFRTLLMCFVFLVCLKKILIKGLTLREVVTEEIVLYRHSKYPKSWLKLTPLLVERMALWLPSELKFNIHILSLTQNFKLRKKLIASSKGKAIILKHSLTRAYIEKK